jgi:2'-5' RNA ligase
MRLFIASPVILSHYDAIKNDFEGIVEGKWVEEENLHLTWVFLGDVSDPQSVIEKLQNVSPLESEISIASLGFFGHPPRILFAKAEEEVKLYSKAKEFKEANFDLYRFKPHITLCRIKTIHNYKAYKEKMKTYHHKVLGVIEPKIILYESVLTDSGPQYKALYEKTYQTSL